MIPTHQHFATPSKNTEIDLEDAFGEQMHLMGQVEALLRQEIIIQKERQRLEQRLVELGDKIKEIKSNGR